MNTFQGRDISIPNKTNIGVLVFAIFIWFLLVIVASHTDHLIIILCCAFLFSFNNNTLFSLLHEATHATHHSDKKWNAWLGRIAAIFFPTGYTFQKYCHLNHHRNNRTDSEMFEAYYPTDNKFLKTLQLYCILGGIYWITVIMTWMALIILPSLLQIPSLRDRANKMAKHTGAQSYFGLFDNNKDMTIIRWELFGTIIFHVLVFTFLNLKFWPVFVLYYAFAINWGGLQYADHAYSPRDIRYGAWNLKVGALTHLVYLNYHYHAVHHEYPHVPWIHLPKFYSDQKSAKKSYWNIYFRMWKGPVPTTEPSPKAIDNDFDNLIMNGLLSKNEH